MTLYSPHSLEDVGIMKGVFLSPQHPTIAVRRLNVSILRLRRGEGAVKSVDVSRKNPIHSQLTVFKTKVGLTDLLQKNSGKS